MRSYHKYLRYIPNSKRLCTTVFLALGPFLTAQATPLVSDQVEVFNSVVTTSETFDVEQRTSVLDAIDALLDIGADGASDMGNLLRDPESKVFTKFMLCDVLARLRGDGIGALEDLFAAVAEERNHVREEAARAINWIAMDPTAQAQAAQLLQQGLSTTLPRLEKDLDAEDPWTRASSARALARLAPFMSTAQKERLVSKLALLMEDADTFEFKGFWEAKPPTDFYRVRDAALWALEQFGPEVPATRVALNQHYFQRLKNKIDVHAPGLEDLADAVNAENAELALQEFKKLIIQRLVDTDFEAPWSWMPAGSAGDLLTNEHTRTDFQLKNETTRYVGAPGAMDWLTYERRNKDWGDMTSRMVWTGALIQHGGFESNADPKYLSHWLAIWSDFDSNFLNQLILAEENYQVFGYIANRHLLASAGWRWPLNVAYRLSARVRGLAAAAKKSSGVLDTELEDFLLVKLLLAASNEIELIIPWISNPNTYNAPSNQLNDCASAMVQAMSALVGFEVKDEPAEDLTANSRWIRALEAYINEYMAYYEDGTELEQSFHYNVHLLDIVRDFLRYSTIRFPTDPKPDFLRRLHKMGLYRYRFLSSIIRPHDGYTPGEAMANAPLQPDYQKYIEDPLVAKILDITETQTGPAPAFDSIMFPWSGYHVLRNGWSKNDTHLYLKGGRKGVGHRSASANAIQLSAFGRKLLVRGGPKSYGTGPFEGHNKYQMSSFAYNTIVVDGKSQRNEQMTSRAEDLIPARWHSSETFDFAESLYDSGYEDIEETIEHRRQVVFVRDLNVFVVTDRIASQDQREYSQVWKFDRTFDREQVEGDSENKVLRTLDTDGANLTLHHFSATPLSYKKYYGQETPRVLGWQGVEPHHKAVDIHANWHGTDAQQVVTLLRPTPNLETEPPTILKIQETGVDGFAMTDTEGNQLKYWSAKSGSSLLGDEAMIQVLGEALLIRTDETGQLFGLALGVNTLQIHGQQHDVISSDFTFLLRENQFILSPIRTPERFEWIDTSGGSVPSYWTSEAEPITYDIITPEPPGEQMRYELWAKHMGLAGEMAELHADPQGVGVSNLLRYAHGMDLEKILYNRLPRFQFFEGDPDVPPRPGLSFYMIDAEDLRFVVEVSTDLLNWSLFPDSNLHVEKIPAHQGLRHVQVQDLEATPIYPAKRFYRIRLSNE